MTEQELLDQYARLYPYRILSDSEVTIACPRTAEEQKDLVEAMADHGDAPVGMHHRKYVWPDESR